MWFDPSPANNELGRRLLTEAVRDVEEKAPSPTHEMLVEATTLADAVGRLDADPPLDLVISHWGHGQAPDGGANGAALLRAAAVRRAEGKGTPPIVIFGGADFEAENRRRALGLGALGFTSEWPVLMSLIERTLGQSPEAH